jgi:hypothetical protein
VAAPAPAALLSWHSAPSSWQLVVVAWLLVGVPMLWAVWRTLGAAAALFV